MRAHSRLPIMRQEALSSQKEGINRFFSRPTYNKVEKFPISCVFASDKFYFSSILSITKKLRDLSNLAASQGQHPARDKCFLGLACGQRRTAEHWKTL